MKLLHPLIFIPAGEKVKPRAYDALQTKACDAAGCTVELPAALDAGCWKIACSHCLAWALVSTETTTREPQAFTMPCGRLQMYGGEL